MEATRVCLSTVAGQSLEMFVAHVHICIFGKFSSKMSNYAQQKFRLGGGIDRGLRWQAYRVQFNNGRVLDKRSMRVQAVHTRGRPAHC